MKTIYFTICSHDGKYAFNDAGRCFSDGINIQSDIKKYLKFWVKQQLKHYSRKVVYAIPSTVFFYEGNKVVEVTL